MRRILVVLIGLLLAAFTATSAQAASAHFVKGPSGTVSGNTLTVTFKAAGLGNADETAIFSLTGTVTVDAQCYTRSGNPVNGVPKSDTVTVNQQEPFPVRNGSVTGTFTVSPLSPLTCTGNQQVRTTVTTANLTVSGPGGVPSAPVTF